MQNETRNSVRVGITIVLGWAFAWPAWGACSADGGSDGRAPGDPRGQFVFHEENDAFAIGSGSDESYTQGLRLSYAYDSGCEPRWAYRLGRGLRNSRIGSWLGIDDPVTHQMRTTLAIGQHIFTPNDLSIPDLIEADRPYAGYLYGSIRLDYSEPKILETTLALTHSYLGGQWYGQTQSSLELQLGVIGPAAGGEWAQSTVHDLIGDEDPKGWRNELPNEPAIYAEYTWRRRFAHISDRLDVVPSFSVALGNVQTYVGSGLMFRYGKNITGFHTDPLSPVADLGDVLEQIDAVCGLKIFVECYAFIGVEGRAVFQNVFLDGTSFSDSHDVDKEDFVYDLMAGFRFRFLWRSLTFDYSFVRRSNEFSPIPPGADQLDGKHDYGAITLRWSTYF